MNLGIDEILHDPSLRAELKNKKVAFLGHNASVTRDGQFSLDALMDCAGIKIVSAFGPQHGMHSEKQDNMIESDDFVHPVYHIPVFSLYGKVRRPTGEMTGTFDIILVDLQDIGSRTYTYMTTLFYMLESCSGTGKSVWVLDRPNPAGRPIEGSILIKGWESFVGPGPLIMRHGLTIGELALWYKDEKKLDLDLRIIRMKGYDPEAGPGYGWPVFELSWVNPSPNASSMNMARCFPGTVLFEGTNLSEGRGTTTPLEVAGAPDINFIPVLEQMDSLEPEWMKGCTVRPCTFEPTFDKHKGKVCSGIHIYADNHLYLHHHFKPYRLGAVLLKAIRLARPDYPLWREFLFEYEPGRMAIDLLSGGTFLREWVDDANAGFPDLDKYLKQDEIRWEHTRESFLLY
jgi:uncharacterized protein YbbC (DUF1343 family)